jgi:hypothetical protein
MLIFEKVLKEFICRIIGIWLEKLIALYEEEMSTIPMVNET